MQKRRKIYLLPVPLKYASFLTLTAGFLSLVMIFVMAWFIQRNYNLFMGDELGISSQVISAIKREQEFLELSLFFLFIASFSIMFAASFYVTRKLTGPIAALERHFDALLKGNRPRPFQLRKNDDFKNLERIIHELDVKLYSSSPHLASGE